MYGSDCDSANHQGQRLPVPFRLANGCSRRARGVRSSTTIGCPVLACLLTMLTMLSAAFVNYAEYAFTLRWVEGPWAPPFGVALGSCAGRVMNFWSARTETTDFRRVAPRSRAGIFGFINLANSCRGLAMSDDRNQNRPVQKQGGDLGRRHPAVRIAAAFKLFCSVDASTLAEQRTA